MPEDVENGVAVVCGHVEMTASVNQDLECRQIFMQIRSFRSQVAKWSFTELIKDVRVGSKFEREFNKLEHCFRVYIVVAIVPNCCVNSCHVAFCKVAADNN